jgi:sulfur-carrier protein
MARIHISYFAILREQRGLGAEEISIAAATAQELYEHLRAAHRFSLPRERVRVAIDNEFASWDSPLRDGQKIVFIPPVAGG